MKKILLGVIGFYRRWVSPLLPGSCRFYPTCSGYAIQAVNRFGVLKGSAKTLVRILKCHPWHPGGYDPVSPEAIPEYEGLRTQGEDIPKGLSSDITEDNITAAPCAPHPAHLER